MRPKRMISRKCLNGVHAKGFYGNERYIFNCHGSGWPISRRYPTYSPMQWYYANNGQRLGPISQEELIKLVTDGVVRSDTLVWHSGMTEWLPYSKVSAGAGSTPGTPAVDDGTEVCAVSGKRYPRSQMINFEGRWISAEHRDEFFQKRREGVAQQLVGDPVMPGPFGYGNVGRRFAARLIDGILLQIVNFCLQAILFAAMGVSKSPAVAGLAAGLSIVVSMTVVACYEIFFTWKNGATLGKQALGLKVLRPDGASLSLGRSVGRYFSTWLSSLTIGIGYIIAGFDEERRALHDRVADTRVIKIR